MYWFSRLLDSASRSRRPLLRLLVAAAIVFAVTAPSVAGVVTVRVDKSEAPFETEEESQEKLGEGLVTRPRRFRERPEYRNRPTSVDRTADSRRRPATSPSRYAAGHRLPNGMLAPLTC